MPIYEYECRGCHNQFEFLVLPTTPPASCPACKSTDLEKLLSLSSVSSDGTRQRSLGLAREKNTTCRLGLPENGPSGSVDRLALCIVSAEDGTEY